MLQKFYYNNSEMVNATEMARPFGKKTVDFLKTNSTAEYIKTFSVMKNLTTDKIVKVIQGGSSNLQGTWMHEGLALEFARWLNPIFAIWCNDRIKELLTTGKTELNPLTEDEMILQSMKILLNRNELLQEQNRLLSETIQLQAPKAQYHDEVLQSESLINTNVIAKELGMSAITLNQKLHQKGVIYKSGETWVLYSQYQGRNYTKTKTVTHEGKNGEKRTCIHTYWTENGRRFIHGLFNSTVDHSIL